MLSLARDRIVVTRGKHLRDNISPSGEVWGHETSLIPPLFIEVPYEASNVSGHVYVC